MSGRDRVRVRADRGVSARRLVLHPEPRSLEVRHDFESDDVNGAAHDDNGASSDDHRITAPNYDNSANAYRSSERMDSPANDVTIHVPTAVLKINQPPNVEVTDKDIIKLLEGQLQASAVRIQELEVATQTIVNIAACALKVLADSGLTDAPDEFSFSYDLVERMRDTPITCTRDFAGGIVVKFREQSPAAILVER